VTCGVFVTPHEMCDGYPVALVRIDVVGTAGTHKVGVPACPEHVEELRA
jgi:hypothetical protein